VSHRTRVRCDGATSRGPGGQDGRDRKGDKQDRIEKPDLQSRPLRKLGYPRVIRGGPEGASPGESTVTIEFEGESDLRKGY